jgi:4-amino-4-deoxy-L-arabinose transferase-like glycosyltransferase
MLDSAFVSESSNETTPDTEPFNWRARFAWSALLVATLYICYFSHLGVVGLTGPDEPRYAWIARSMAETGDWITPRLYGQPWFEKPPLYYWGAALSFKLFGVSEVAARLPSAVAALLGTLSLAWLAWRMYGARAARWLLLFLPTTVGMIGFSHAAATDMPFSGMLTMAMVAAASLLRLGSDANGEHSDTRAEPPWEVTLARCIFGLALALAVLAKGPAALILCGGTIFVWAAVSKRWQDSLRLLHPLAVGIFLITAAPWYVICQRSNPEFFQIFIVEHNFKRYLTPEFQHIQPFWFYVPVVAVAFLPWAPLLAWSIWRAVAELRLTKRLSDGAAFFWAWALFCLVFFSVSRSKLPGYILPALPPLATLAAQFYVSERKPSKSLQWTHVLTALLLAMLFAGVELGAPYASGKGIEFDIAIGSVIAAIGLANLILGGASTAGKPTPHRELSAALCVIPILLVVLFSNRLAGSLLDGDPSGKSIAYELQALGIPLDRLSVAGLNRGEHYSLNFYLHHEVRDWDPRTPVSGYVIAKSKTCALLAPQPWVCQDIPFITQKRNRSIYRISQN